MADDEAPQGAVAIVGDKEKAAKGGKPSKDAAATKDIGAVAPIDPRLRARRIAVRREEGRRRLRALFVVGVLVGLLALAIGVAVSPLLSVDKVAVAGNVYADPAAIDALVKRAEGRPMLAVDLGKLERDFEAIPWVRNAEVRRDWPRRIVVDLAERRPVMTYFASDGQYRVVDVDGRVLAAVGGQPIDLLGVSGAGPVVAPGELVPDPYKAAARLANDLPGELRARAVALDLAPNGELSLRLQPRGVVLFGPPEDLRAKLVAALTVLPDTDPKTLGTLDVRVPDKPVLTEGKP